MSSLPVELEIILLKAIAREPSERYATAQELAEDLRRFRDNRPIIARRPTLFDRGRKWRRRNRLLVNALLAVLVVAIISGLLVTNARNQTALERQLRQQQEALAELGEQNRRQHDYVVHINLAWQAWTASQFPEMRRYLELCLPRDDEDDLRSFEWHYLWKLAHSLPPLVGRHEGPAFTLAFSPDGALLASGGKDGVRIWSYPSGEPIIWLRDLSEVNRISFAPDGRFMATSSGDGVGRIWETASWSVVQRISPEWPVVGVAFAPDGTYLAVAETQPDGPACRITHREPSTGKSLAVFDDFREGFHSGTLSPDGRFGAAACRDLKLHVWDLRTGK